MRIRKNFKEPIILPCMKASTYSPASDKCRVPRVRQFDKNFRHLIVIVLRGEYKISITKE